MADLYFRIMFFYIIIGIFSMKIIAIVHELSDNDAESMNQFIQSMIIIIPGIYCMAVVITLTHYLFE